MTNSIYIVTKYTECKIAFMAAYTCIICTVKKKEGLFEQFSIKIQCTVIKCDILYFRIRMNKFRRRFCLVWLDMEPALDLEIVEISTQSGRDTRVALVSSGINK